MRRHRRFELADHLHPEDAKPDDDGEAHGFAHWINSGHEVEVVEVNKSGCEPVQWLHSPSRGAIRVRGTREVPFCRPLRGWRQFLLAAFLPVGFPNSVSRDYLAYQAYDSLQAFFSTITSLLANRALLQGLGVGDADSSATYAMLLTISKDAVSRVATIVFAHRFGLGIEPEAKRFRFLADVFNDTAFFLELYSPYLGSWRKLVALCTGEALRAVCGVAAGASKAALSLHFAKKDNLSELNAKEASQETAVGLIGLLVGTVVVRLVQDHRAVVCLMAVLVLAHLWVNYRGVRSVHMTTLNKQRATLLFGVFLESSTVWTPEQVAEEERILFWDGVMGNARKEPVFRIDFAKSYGDAVGPSRAGEDAVVVDGPMHTRFIRPYAPGRLGQVKILLWDGAEAKHALVAWFMAMDTAWVTDKDAPYGDAFAGDVKGHRMDGWRPCARDALLWDKMEKQGWDLETGALETGAGARVKVERIRRKVE